MFQVAISVAQLVTQPTGYPFYCEYAMLYRGLSVCLHLLMWVNQHRRAVGVWIPNPWGGQVLSYMALLIQTQVQQWGPVSGVRAPRQSPDSQER